MIPYSRPKCSDLYTLSQSKLVENHTLHSGTYLYRPYMAVPPLSGHTGFHRFTKIGQIFHKQAPDMNKYILNEKKNPI